MALLIQVLCLVVACHVYSASTFFLDSLVEEEEHVLNKRSSDDESTEYPWAPFKPSRDLIGKDCYINNTYETVWPYECEYYLKQDTEFTIPCQPFCQLWVDNMKAGLNLSDDCKFHDLNQPSYCTSHVKNKCSRCAYPTSRLFLTCCGTCTALC